MGCCCSKDQTKMVVALFDYNARENIDISFHKGDEMEVIDDTESDWLRVKHKSSHERGLIPRTFVAEKGTVNCEDWFFDNISRKEAEKLLMGCELKQGTFLIRPSEQHPNRFSLSVKNFDREKRYHVKHYKIKPHETRGGYYIAHDQIFPTLLSLIDTYSRYPMGMNPALTRPCPKEPPIIYDLAPSMRTDWEVNRSEIKTMRRLGAGNFGEVYYGKWRNNIDVAIKTLKEGTMSKQAFLEEAGIMKKFRHTRLVALYGVCSKQDPVYIVQEYMCCGSLLDFLHKDQGRRLKIEDLVYIAAQVAAGMEYLEKKQLIHRDLAARNVLVGENLIAKIADFGLARIIKNDVYEASTGTRFPIKWTAPEAITRGIFTTKSDVWSYGVLLWELFTYGRIPYAGMGSEDIINKVERGYRLQVPPKSIITEEIYNTMLTCWEARPEKRPTFEYMRHFFENFSVATEMQYTDI